MLADATVGPVNIFDDDTDILLQTVVDPERVQKGVFRVFTDPAWNIQRRRVRDEWTVLPDGATDPVVLSETFLILESDECETLDHVDDGVAVSVGGRLQTSENTLFELRVSEKCLHDNLPAGTPVSCLGDRLLDAMQEAERCGPGNFDSASTPSLEIHPHTPWWNALIRIFNLVPSTRIRRVWVHERLCLPVNGVPTVVMVFRFLDCSAG